MEYIHFSTLPTGISPIGLIPLAFFYLLPIFCTVNFPLQQAGEAF